MCALRMCACVGICFISAGQAEAQEVGEYGFLTLPVSARAAALGGTAISVVEPELPLADQNPALLCSEMVGETAVSYMNYVGDIHLAYAGYAGRFLDQGAWSGSVRYVGYGDFAGYDAYGTPTGTFGAKDIAFGIGVGHPINEKWNIGGAVRAIYTKYEEYSAFALGVDVGLNYYNEVSGRSFSIVAANLGGQLKKLEERRSRLPSQLNMGWSKELEHLPLTLTLTGYDLLEWGDYGLLEHLIFGLEWTPMGQFYVAASYNYRRQHDMKEMGGWLRGVSLGAGLDYRQYTFQLSYARYSSADGSLLVGLNYRF